jgi:hypothetical protein
MKTKKVYFKNDGTKVIEYIYPKTRKGFSIKDSVIYMGKEYNIHSFPIYEKDEVYLRKYKKNGLMDSRFKGITVKISDIKKNSN